MAEPFVGARKADAWHIEAGRDAGLFRGVVMRYNGRGWVRLWWSRPYASAQQARLVAVGKLWKVSDHG